MFEVGGSAFDRSRDARPHPRRFAKRGCKLLKTKGTSVEKSAKRGQRGGKCLKAKGKWRVASGEGRQEGEKRTKFPPFHKPKGRPPVHGVLMKGDVDGDYLVCYYIPAA